MEKVDRRVKRTHRLLGEALIALALEKSYDDVTIRDITERADVAYITFFRHYQDKNDLLTKLLQEMLDELERLTHEDNRATEGLLIFQHVQQYAAMYQMVLSSESTLPVRRRIRDSIAAHLIAVCTPLRNVADEMDVPLEIIAHHKAASLLALIEWWLEHNMPYPLERMAEIYNRLILDSVMHLIC